MFTWIILFWAFICSNPNHTPGNHGNCNLIHITTTSSSADTGGETGDLPPKPPTPPPPPPPPPGS